MSLTDSKVRAAKPAERPYKLFDGKGLYLLVAPTGGKLWRFKFKMHGREKLLALGQYPDVSLEKARKRRSDAREKVADGVDPAAQKRVAKAAAASTLAAVADEWLGLQKTVEPATRQRIRDRLDRWILPTLGSRPIDQVAAADILPLLRRIETAGRHETAHRTRADLGRLMRHAVASGRAKMDVTADLKGALAPVKTKHFPAITNPARFGELLRAIDGYKGQPTVELALKLAPYVFVRPGELRAAEWTEFDSRRAEWRIPSHKTKMRREHVVPLARQVVALVDDLRAHSGSGRLLFPTLADPERPLSENTLNACLRRLGFGGDEMTAHGFRSSASSLLRELGFSSEVIEKQLAHEDSNATRAAYDRAERLDARRKLMQAWADYCDTLRSTVPK